VQLRWRRDDLHLQRDLGLQLLEPGSLSPDHSGPDLRHLRLGASSSMPTARSAHSSRKARMNGTATTRERAPSASAAKCQTRTTSPGQQGGGARSSPASRRGSPKPSSQAHRHGLT
jgi:hypothetical protein